MPIVLFLAFVFSAAADDAFRSYHIGNSLTWDLQPAGIAAIASQRQLSQQVGYHIECGKPLPHIWANPDSTCVKPVAEFGTFRPALSEKSWHTITIQPYRGSTLAEDARVILEIIDLARQNPANANTRFVIHCAWPGKQGKDYAREWTQKVPDADHTPTTLCRDYFTHLMRRVRAATTVDVAMLPAGELLFQLDRELRKAPLGELRGAESLYRDAVHLKTDVGRFAVAATAFAVIHKASPLGLKKPDGAYGKAEAFPPGYVDLVTRTIAAVLAPTRADSARRRRIENPDAPWHMMVDTGPFISDTFLGPGADNDVIALKGIAIKLGADERSSVLFDTEALRMVAAFDGQVTLAGTPWDGRHGGNSHTPAEQQAYSLFSPKVGRVSGQFRGLYRHGNEAVLAYQLGNTEIMELPELVDGSISRSFSIGAALAEFAIPIAGLPGVQGEPDPKSEVGARVLVDRVDGPLDELMMGAPRSDDTAATLKIREVRKNEVFAGFTDGVVHPSQKAVFDGQAPARTTVDLGRPIAIARINTYSSFGHRARQRFTIWGSQAEEQPSLAVGSPKVQGWSRIALADTGSLPAGGSHASSVYGDDGLGTWRHLAFVFEKVNARGHGTLFDEIDILAQTDELPPFRDRYARDIELHVTDLPAGVTLENDHLRVPAGSPAFRCRVSYVDAGKAAPQAAPRDLETLLQGGPAIFPDVQITHGKPGPDRAPYAVDTIPLPQDNPWEAKTRFGGFDFFADGKRAACSTWNGDVWIVEGIDGLEELRWRRFASGLFQTLGLRIVNDVIYVQGRDQITRLHDNNGDGEADFYECFNNEVKITSGFHEFSFDLQTDAAGNFYFSKGMPVLGGGRGFAPWTEHNGAVLKVSPAGKLERVAWGLRAPGGIGIGPNGEITTGENEGSWVPRCKITWSKPGSFHGVVPSQWYGRKFVRTLPDAPTDYEKPLCWLPYHVDNSSGSQIWVPEGNWDPRHAGEMLHLSYGKASIFRVLREEVDGQIQGGVSRLPVDLAVAPMRARFHPKTGDLYVIGLRGWQTSGADAFQRLRYIAPGAPSPVSLQTHSNGMVIGFSAPISAESANDAQRFAVSKWKYIWGPQYGSGRFSIDNPDVDAEAAALKEPSKGSHNKVDRVHVRASARLPGNRVFLYIPDMTPAMQMEIRMDLAAADGEEFRSSIHNSIHALRPPFDDHGLDLTNLPETPRRVVGDPGLIMRLAFRSTDDVTRVDRLALNVDADHPITPFFRPRAFEATFSGDLVVAARDDLAFQLRGSGFATLSIDGQVILDGELPLESEAISLNAGPHILFASFQGDKKGVGRIQLQWSGNDFVWEPVPPQAFRHLADPGLAHKDRVRHGRAIFAAARCIRCHSTDFALGPKTMPELAEQDADFANIAGRLRADWLAEWLRTPQNHCLPVPGAEAADVLAWFQSQKQVIPVSAVEASGDGDTLIKDLHLAPWLAKIRGKYTTGGLRAFLADPTAHHADTLFPKLALSPGEVEAIARTLDVPAAKIAGAGDADRGKQVVGERCAACHSAGKAQATKLTSIWKRDWSRLDSHDPPLGLSPAQIVALQSFQNADSDSGLRSLAHFTPREYAERTLTRLKCAHCHEGGTLPAISQAGAKLQGPWLAELLRGSHTPARPWLAARMPAFPSRARALARGICDRDGEPFADSATARQADSSAIGAELAGLQGYACNACHAIADQPALQAFEGQGPNLELSKARLRWSYFQRWLHQPQRIQPGTIMPRYSLDKTRAAKADVLDGAAAAQFKAIWEWIQGL